MPEQDAITCIIHDLYESWRYDTKQFSTTTSFAGYLGGEIYRLRSLLRDRSESLSKDRDRVVRVLNEAYRKDPCAINKLFSLEVVCTSELADHPTIQVKSYETDTDASTYYTLRLIGLINGLVGCDLHRQGFIAEVHDDHGKLVGFTTVNNNVKRNATWPREIPDVLDEIRSKAEAVMQVGIPAPDGVWEDAKAALSAYVAKNPYAVSHLVGRLEEAQNELNWLKYGIRSENYPGTPHPSKTPEGR
jgi:hypothetical protein